MLRPPIEDDLDGWARLMADEESSMFIGGPMPRASAWRSMAAMAGSWHLKGFGMFSVIEKASGAWVGRLGPWQPEGWPGTEIGWGLLREAWGKGYASEGALRTMAWAFEELRWTDVIHCIGPKNNASAAVAARLRSRKRGEGKLPPPFEASRVDIWGQSAGEWRLNWS